MTSRINIKLAITIIFVFTFVSYYYFQVNVDFINIKYKKNEDHISQSTNELIPIIHFKAIHDQIVIHRSEKRVVFNESPHTGYGNRVYSMLSAFLVAVVTESAILISRWPYINEYIQFTIVGAFSQYTDTNFLNINYNSKSICKINSESNKNIWSYNKLITPIKNKQIPGNHSRYHFAEYTAYFFELASNLEYAQKLVNFGMVSEKTVERAKESINDSRIEEKKKIENLYAIGFEFAGHVLNNYWFLNSNLKRRTTQFIQKNNFKDSFIIGIQMRFDYLNETDIDVFARCAFDIERNNKELIGDRPVKWFLASDRVEFFHDALVKKLKEKYSKYVISADGKIGHIANNYAFYERTLLDIELLSLCNETIITGGSTFGFIGSLKSQKRPYCVEGRRPVVTECKLLEFSSPCRNFKNSALF